MYYNGDDKEYDSHTELEKILNEKQNKRYAGENKLSNAFGFWASYQITGDSILILRQLLAPGKRMYEDKGRIINDTTFYVFATREYKSGKFKNFDQPEYYHFIKTIDKTDSVNIFFK